MLLYHTNITKRTRTVELESVIRRGYTTDLGHTRLALKSILLQKARNFFSLCLSNTK
jgi:hypothetical protein